jgi:O-acetylserine/cysteine efflux transporter
MRSVHVALAVLVAAVWGLNFVVIEVGLDDFPPLLLSALRYLLASLPLLVLGGARPAPWRWILAAGVAIGLVQFSLLFIGMDVGMPAGLASVLMQTQALFTIAFAVPLLHERIGAAQAGGVVLALAGLALVAGGLDGGATVPGFLLVLGAAAGWGAGNICVRAARPQDPLRFMTWICVVPPLPLLALSLAVEGPGEIGTALSGLDPGGLGAVAYIAFAATTLGWAAWGSLLKRYPAAVVAPFSMLVPIFGLASAALLLGEPLTLTRLVATALVVGGVMIALRASRAPRAARTNAAAAPAPSKA